jgi:GT2 family glycosyltransferase
LEHELHKSGSILYLKAIRLGAASQRNQGVEHACNPFILFADDDVYLERDCIANLWQAIGEHDNVGGVSAMITNQKYLSMGMVTSAVVQFLLGKKMQSYAGKVIPPGWGMLPEDREDLPANVEVEWVNLGATLYRREALPIPPFQSHFVGYSLMEDLTLSVLVSKKWKLLNARMARIYHDSQPGDHKKNVLRLSEMELINRHYLMRNVLGKSSFLDYIKLFVFELFQVFSGLRSRGGLKRIGLEFVGKVTAIFKIMMGNS